MDKKHPSFMELPTFFFKDRKDQRLVICPFIEKACLGRDCACWVNLVMDTHEGKDLVTVGGRCGMIQTDYAERLTEAGKTVQDAD